MEHRKKRGHADGERQGAKCVVRDALLDGRRARVLEALEARVSSFCASMPPEPLKCIEAAQEEHQHLTEHVAVDEIPQELSGKSFSTCPCVGPKR